MTDQPENRPVVGRIEFGPEGEGPPGIDIYIAVVCMVQHQQMQREIARLRAELEAARKNRDEAETARQAAVRVREQAVDRSTIYRRERDEARAGAAAMRAALEWYAGNAADCRKITSAGDVARRALDRDGGGHARVALASDAGRAWMEERERVRAAAREAIAATTPTPQEGWEQKMWAALRLAAAREGLLREARGLREDSDRCLRRAQGLERLAREGEETDQEVTPC